MRTGSISRRGNVKLEASPKPCFRTSRVVLPLLLLLTTPILDTIVPFGVGPLRAYSLSEGRSVEDPRKVRGRWRRFLLASPLMWRTATKPGCLFGMETRHPDNGRFRQLRFSPDGRYILAADDGSLWVLGTSPFAILHRIRAPNVRFSGFSKGSAEIWYVIDQEYIGTVHQVRLRPRADVLMERRSTLSGEKFGSFRLPNCSRRSDAIDPEGSTYVCVDHAGTLRLFDPQTGDLLFERKNFGKPLYEFLGDSLDTVEVGDPGSATFAFSPDGRYLIAQPAAARGGVLAWDRVERTEILLKGALKGRHDALAFVGPMTVLISKAGGTKPITGKSVTFPGGELIGRPLLPPGIVHSLSDPSFVVIRPFGRRATYKDAVQRAAAIDLKTGKAIISETPVLDVLGALYVVELTNGDLGLYEAGKGIKATVRIPSAE